MEAISTTEYRKDMLELIALAKEMVQRQKDFVKNSNPDTRAYHICLCFHW